MNSLHYTRDNIDVSIDHSYSPLLDVAMDAMNGPGCEQHREATNYLPLPGFGEVVKRKMVIVGGARCRRCSVFTRRPVGLEKVL